MQKGLVHGGSSTCERVSHPWRLQKKSAQAADPGSCGCGKPSLRMFCTQIAHANAAIVFARFASCSPGTWRPLCHTLHTPLSPAPHPCHLSWSAGLCVPQPGLIGPHPGRWITWERQGCRADAILGSQSTKIQGTAVCMRTPALDRQQIKAADA